MRSSSLPRPACLALLAPLLGVACRGPSPSPADGDAPAPPPPSALVGLLQALSALEELRPREAEIEVRALESDTLHDPRHSGEHVRVLLQLTVFADTLDQARGAFEELLRALQEPGSGQRPAPADPEAVGRRLAGLDAALSPAGGAARESYSDQLRIELPAAALAPGAPGPARLAPTGLESMPAEEYVRTVAASCSLAPLELQQRVLEQRELLCLLRPPDRDAHFSRSRIGAFLATLEARSPRARVTHLSIQRLGHLPELLAPDGWTFEAGLTVRP